MVIDWNIVALAGIGYIISIIIITEIWNGIKKLFRKIRTIRKERKQRQNSDFEQLQNEILYLRNKLNETQPTERRFPLRRV